MKSKTRKHPVAVVCEKFQPFHSEHLAYVRAAFSASERVIVGITNADASMIRHEEADPKRSLPESNPFSYYERYRMIEESLADCRIPRKRFDIVPFPVNRLELLVSYLPKNAVILVTLYGDDPWLVERRAKLEAAGWSTDVLWNRPTKGMTASGVRALIREGGKWEHLVPAAVSRIVKRIARERPI